MSRFSIPEVESHESTPLLPSEVERLKQRFPEFIGHSEPFYRMLQQIERVASAEAPLLILGESGTGKELVARAIHRLGPRRHGPFVGENCAAISPPILESELFGHDRGAFTGAHSERAGLIESAHGGILFLDEITETSGDLQSKLLRVLQEKEIRRVGGNRSRKIDFRLVTASHRNTRRGGRRKTVYAMTCATESTYSECNCRHSANGVRIFRSSAELFSIDTAEDSAKRCRSFLRMR